MDGRVALMVSLMTFISMAMARIKCQLTRDSTQIFFLFWTEECSPLPMSGVAVKAVAYGTARFETEPEMFEDFEHVQNFWFRVGEQPQT
jgi:hypothetical protein